MGFSQTSQSSRLLLCLQPHVHMPLPTLCILAALFTLNFGKYCYVPQSAFSVISCVTISTKLSGLKQKQLILSLVTGAKRGLTDLDQAWVVLLPRFGLYQICPTCLSSLASSATQSMCFSSEQKRVKQKHWMTSKFQAQKQHTNTSACTLLSQSGHIINPNINGAEK